MGKLYRWVKWNNWWIWEGDNLVVVGDKTRYSVHEKGTVNIYKDKTTYRHKGYYGTYETRKEALDLLKQVDSAMNSGEELILMLSGGDSDEFKKGGAWTSYVLDTGAMIIIYHSDYPTDLIHELEHKRLGHFRYRVTPEQEVEVVGNTIKIQKERDLYNPDERRRTIDLLSGYIRGSRKKAKVQAESIVLALERDEELQIGDIKWKIREGRLI